MIHCEKVGRDLEGVTQNRRQKGRLKVKGRPKGVREEKTGIMERYIDH